VKIVLPEKDKREVVAVCEGGLYVGWYPESFSHHLPLFGLGKRPRIVPEPFYPVSDGVVVAKGTLVSRKAGVGTNESEPGGDNPPVDLCDFSQLVYPGFDVVVFVSDVEGFRWERVVGICFEKVATGGFVYLLTTNDRGFDVFVPGARGKDEDLYGHILVATRFPDSLNPPGRTAAMSRLDDLDCLYTLLTDLEDRVGGKQRLGDCTGYMDWPERGVYFFFAPDEHRDSGDEQRLTRIGTHAVSSGAGTTIWNRLRTHRGANSGTYGGGGNHRGSVFRKRVGEALIERADLHDDYPYWGEGSTAGRERRLSEHELEQRVSDYIRDLPFLWVNIDDEPGPESDRAYVERNAIALVSNFQKDSIDPREDDWLGKDSPRKEIHESGLWNINHVEEDYDPAFLDRLETAVEETKPP